MYVRAPSKITLGILKFCKTINPNSQPLYVQISPIDDAIPNECFANVEEKIKHSGGKTLHGWTIWEFKGVFYEAEFHAIWESPKGGLLDVSLPSGTKERRRLFLPDPDKSFANQRVNNIRKALRSDIVIQDYFKAFDEKLALMNKYSLPGEFGLVKMPKNEADAIEMKIANLKVDLIKLPPLDPHSSCFCGSGMKYKHCCL